MTRPVYLATKLGGAALAELLRARLGPDVAFGLVVWVGDANTSPGEHFDTRAAFYGLGSLDQATAAMTSLRDSIRAQRD